MPSKKRKYNARFPAGRIKKIMQTDEEVGKVAQAVPIIICTAPRTLELFVESLLSKAMQVTMARNAKTLSPSHVKQCILAESRFDFLRDLVKNIPDVSAAEEKEMSAESSPNSSRFSDVSVPRRIAREDSNSSSSSDIKVQHPLPASSELRRVLCTDTEPRKTETVTSIPEAIDLTKKDERTRPNFYQETLPDEVQHKSVITVNPIYASPLPSTSTYINKVEPAHRLELVPKEKPLSCLDLQADGATVRPRAPVTPITPVLNIDFSINPGKPEIKRIDTTAASIVGATNKKLQRQNSKAKEPKKVEKIPTPVDIDHLNSDNLQIDEDYDT